MKTTSLYTHIMVNWFVLQRIKGGQVCAYNQYFNSTACKNFLKSLSEELNVNGKNYDTFEGYSKYKKDF